MLLFDMPIQDALASSLTF